MCCTYVAVAVAVAIAITSQSIANQKQKQKQKQQQNIINKKNNHSILSLLISNFYIKYNSFFFKKK